jgi:hypothetical protein
MTGDLPAGTPARQFVDDMAQAGVPVRAESDRVVYDVVSTGGAYAGQAITTGLSMAEIQAWPQVPPHWVQLPAPISLPNTNPDAGDCPPGWYRHSREFVWTDMSVPPAIAWLRHMRGLIAAAIPAAA